MDAIDYAISMIKKWEGFHDKAYLCPAGVWTIGFGRTGPDVKAGSTTTLPGEESWLRRRLEQDITYVKSIVKPEQLTRHLKVVDIEKCYGALASLVYNIGGKNFKYSSLVKAIKEGNSIQSIEKYWMMWNKAKGQILPGLVKRRADELALFKSGLQLPPQNVV